MGGIAGSEINCSDFIQRVWGIRRRIYQWPAAVPIGYVCMYQCLGERKTKGQYMVVDEECGGQSMLIEHIVLGGLNKKNDTSRQLRRAFTWPIGRVR